MGITDQVEMQKTAEKDFRLFFFILLMLLIFIMAARTPLDSDMWWHLHAGKDTLREGTPTLLDTYSFSRYGSEWINHSWLSQVILYLVFYYANAPGLSTLVAISAVTSLGLIYVQMDGAPIFKGVLLILAAIVASWVWSPRPQVFSLILFAWIYLILSKYKYRRINSLWQLFPIFVLWSNLHAGFSLGLILLIVTIIGELINKILLIDTYFGMDWRQLGILTLWSAACLIAILINPNGFDTWLIPFKTVGVSTLQNFISEWASPDFHQNGMFFFLILIFLGGISFGLIKRQVDGSDLVGYVVFGGMALVSQRNFAPFALFITPVIARYLNYSINDAISGEEKSFKIFAKVSKESNPIKPLLRKVINLVIIFVLALVSIIKVVYVSHPVVVRHYENLFYPAQALGLIPTASTHNKLLNSYGWGGFIGWQRNDLLVFVDGRTDLFGDEIIDKWIELMQADKDWQVFLDQENIDYILIEPNRPLVGELRSAGWTLIYEDSLSVLFGK